MYCFAKNAYELAKLYMGTSEQEMYLRSKVCDSGILIQLLTFWILSIALFFYLKTVFWRLDSVSILVRNVLFAQTVCGVSHVPYLLV
jgi:hypothetical protein